MRTRGVPNVRWLPLQPADRLAEFLSMADLHVLPQRAEAEELVMPSKLTSILAIGGAAIATATAGSALGRIVNRCGLLVPPGSVSELTEAVVTLAYDPSRRRAMGQKGRAIAEAELSSDAILGEFELTLQAIVEDRRESRSG